jgi:thioredoxin-related protein
MKRFYSLPVYFLLFIFALKPVMLLAQTAEKPGIQWLTMEEALKKNAKKPKKFMIDVYTDWCGWCKVMDKETFSDPTIIAYVNANYYAVKFNAEQTTPINFNGKDYNFVVTDATRNKGYHELAYFLVNGRLSYPTVAFLDENLTLIQPIPGYQKPPQLDIILKYFGGDHYKKTEYATFQKTYVSPYAQ